MALRPIGTAAVGLAMVALASCGGGDDSETTTDAAQAEGGGANGLVGEILQDFSAPGSASGEFEALDWEGNLVREVSSGTNAPRGMKVVETTESTAPGLCRSRCFFLIRDRPALTGADLAGAEQELDPTTNQPSVVLSLTPEGLSSFERLTRRVAQRGEKRQDPGAPPSESAEHVALVVDDRVLSLPIIDFTENPQGIDASSGVQITGGFTLAEAQDLAQALNPD